MCYDRNVYYRSYITYVYDSSKLPTTQFLHYGIYKYIFVTLKLFK